MIVVSVCIDTTVPQDEFRERAERVAKENELLVGCIHRDGRGDDQWYSMVVVDPTGASCGELVDDKDGEPYMVPTDCALDDMDGYYAQPFAEEFGCEAFDLDVLGVDFS